MKLGFTITVLMALCTTARAQTADLVQAELVADTTAIEAGKSFQVGLHLQIADGWHVYWSNPGDAGAPTMLKLTLPEGFKAGAVQYPVPEKLAQPGNLTVYAYEHDVLLTATVAPPNDLIDTRITVSANAGWCVCDPSKCILGKKALSLELPVATGVIRGANSALFAAWQPRMPANREDKFSDVHFGYVASGGEITPYVKLVWKNLPPATEFEWLPGPVDDLKLQVGEVTTENHTSAFSLTGRPLQGISPTESTLTGILAYHVQGQARGVAVTLDRKKLGLPVPADRPDAK